MVEGSNGAMAFVGPDIAVGGGVAIGMRKKDTQLSDQLNAALATLKSNGTVDKLIMEYFEKGPFFSE